MRRKGFTLIELLIVIAIAAIIAGAMVPLFNVTRQEAKEAKALSELDVIKTAAIMLHHDTDAWPSTGTDGSGLLQDDGIYDWDGPYIDAWNNDPWGSPYRIRDEGVKVYVYTYGQDSGDDWSSGIGGDDLGVLLTPNRSK